MKNVIKKPVVFFVVILLILIVLRLPSSFVPFFNIDEGIFAAFANSIINAGVPYRDVVDTLAPLTSYFFAAIFLVFGRNNMFAVHVALIFLILGITIALYFVGSKARSRAAGYLAAFLFCMFSYNFFEPDMLAFETEWLLVLFSSLGAYFLLSYFFKNKNLFLFLSGASFGLAFFSKQPALLIYLTTLIFCFIYTYSSGKNIYAGAKSVIISLSGFLLINAFFIGYFYINHALRDFWFWFWVYFNKYYIPAVPIWEKIRMAFNFEESYFKANYLLLILFVSNILITCISTLSAFKKNKGFERKLFIDWYFISWCIFSYLAVTYSGRNYGHYYIMVLAPLCIVGGQTLIYLWGVLNSALQYYGDKYNLRKIYRSALKLSLPVIVMLSIIDPLELVSSRLISWGVFTGRFTRESFVSEDFRVVPDYIRRNSRVGDKILVWGFAPEFYALAGRLPASRYIYSNYLTGFIPWVNWQSGIDTSWAVVPGAWEIFLKEMNASKPVYIIDTSFTNYRCYHKFAPEKFKEFSSYLKENYVVEKILHIETGDWDFRIFRRKS